MTFLTVFIIWLILNGKITLEICVIGVLLSAVLHWFSGKYIPGEKGKKLSFRRIIRFIRYLGLLFIEIVKANIQVLGIVLRGQTDFQPRLVNFRVNLKETSSKVLLANSITLTPGTITAAVEKDRYVVHCLDRSMNEDIGESIFVQNLRKIEEV